MKDMNKRRFFFLSFSTACVIMVIIGLFYWYAEQLTEQKLQFYIQTLESRGINVEERSLQSFSDEEILMSVFWNDFTMEIEILQINRVYYDRGKCLLYFIRPVPRNEIKVEAFSYKWKITDLIL